MDQGVLSPHFGHCSEFAFIEVDTENKRIIRSRIISAPAHQPGLLPQWLTESGCDMVIAGGMGHRAIDLFRLKGIEVICGAPSQSPPEIVMAYLNGKLSNSGNLCDEPGFKQAGGHNCGKHKTGF
jgi:ATP-binding protein involved in chromosome partitioning